VLSGAELHHLMATRLGSLHRHKFFNTNNLWVNLDKLQATLDEQGGLLKLPLIKNKKTVRTYQRLMPHRLHAVQDSCSCMLQCWSATCTEDVAASSLHANMPENLCTSCTT
jgi:UTP--glucose-1-phosphate uridylyltransferase